MGRGAASTTTTVLSSVVAGLMIVASIGGLVVDDLYRESPDVVAVLRGGDLVNLVVAVPILVIAMWLTWRGSLRAHLVWLAMLSYTAYGYAYYVFDPSFNDFFLVHVAIFTVAIVALGFGFGALDVTELTPRFSSVWLPRVVAAFLIGAMAYMAVVYSVEVIRYLGGGEYPTDVVPVPPWRVHLGYALDLSVLVPSAAVAGVLVWRKSPWGNPVATVVLVFLCVYQLSFLGAAVFMNSAGIAGAADAIPKAIMSAVVFAVPAGIMLWGVTGRIRDAADR